MLRVGIVAEGKSEWFVLEEVIKGLVSNCDFVRLRPDLTLVSKSPHGWKGVAAWCKQNGPSLQAIMAGVVGRPLHLLLIHVDCSMAHNVGADRPCPPASDTANALRAVIAQQWLGLPRLPPNIVLVTPSRQTDTWVVSVLDPPYVPQVPRECDPRPEEELVSRHLLRKKGGEVKKPEGRYFPLAMGVARRFDDVCTACMEAERFRTEFLAAAGPLLPQ